MKSVRRHYSQSGLSLIELLIALFLGIVLVSLAVPSFIGSLEVFKSSTAFSKTSETGRFALTVLARDIRNAGFRGCDLGQVSISNQTGDSLYDFGYRLNGQERASSEAITNIESGITIKDATDALTISTLKNKDTFLSTAFASSSETATLNSSGNFAVGDIVYMGDCEYSAILKVESTTGNDVTFTAPPGIYFKAGTDIYLYEQTTYFIAESKLYVNNRNQKPNSLWRKINANTSEELVAGIENLQLTYGLDNNSDGVANMIVTAPSATAFPNVTIVRFKVQATSLDALDASGVLKKSFSMSVNLRNG